MGFWNHRGCSQCDDKVDDDSKKEIPHKSDNFCISTKGIVPLMTLADAVFGEVDACERFGIVLAGGDP